MSAPARRLVGYRVKSIRPGDDAPYLVRVDGGYGRTSIASKALLWEYSETGRLHALEALLLASRSFTFASAAPLRLVRVARVSAAAKERARCASLVLSLIERFASVESVSTTELDTLLVAIETGLS